MAMDILNMLRNNFGYLLEEKDFKVLERHESGSFGNFYLILDSEDMSIRITLDRGTEMVDIAIPDEDGWIDMAFVMVLLNQGNLMDSYDFTKFGEFLKTNYSSVKDLFSRTNIVKTTEEIKKLGELRAKKMFPDLYGN